MSAFYKQNELYIPEDKTTEQWERFWEEEKFYDGAVKAANQEDFTYPERPKKLTPEELDALQFVDFCSERITLRRKNTNELLERLEEITDSYTRAWLKHNYYRIRPEYCALQIELNIRYERGEIGVPSPAFRPHLPLSPQPKYGQAELSNDTQLFDLHFLHCMNVCNAAHCSFADKALAQKEFGFDDAFRFCNRASSKKKLTLLRFDDSPQNRHLELWGLLSIKEKSAKVETREYQRLLRSVESRLRKIVSRKSADLKLWAALVVANEILSESELEVSPANLNKVAKLLIGAVSVPVRALKPKLEQALKRLEE